MATDGARIRFEGFEYDPHNRELLTRTGDVVSLPPRATELLHCLILRAGQLVTKEQIIAEVWDGLHVMDHSLTEAMGVLRNALGDDAREPRYICTVPRRGYRFIAAAEAVESTSPPRSATHAAPRSLTTKGPVESAAASGTVEPQTSVSALRMAFPVVLIVSITMSVLGGTTTPQRQPLEGIPVAVTLEPELSLNIESSFAVRLSPDGRWMLYRSGNRGWAGGRIYRRPLASHRATALPGSEGGLYPAISPSGEDYSFFKPDGDTGIAEWRYRLMIAPATGGIPKTMAITGVPFGAAWIDDRRIVFSMIRAAGPSGPRRRQVQGLYLLELGSTRAVRLTEAEATEGEDAHVWPAAIPGTSAVLFTIVADGAAHSEESSIGLLDIDTGERLVLLHGGSHPVYSPSGHILFLRRGRLLAAPFDIGRRVVTDTPRTVLDDVLEYDVWSTPGYDISDRGHLVYLSGPRPEWSPRMALIDPDTAAIEWLSTPTSRHLSAPRFSSDGTRLAFGRWAATTTQAQLAVVDLTSGIDTPTPLPGNMSGIAWGPEAERLTFAWTDAEQNWGIRSQRIDGSDPDELMNTDSRAAVGAGEWLANGALLFTRWGGPTRWDIWILRPDGIAAPLLANPAPETCPRISPDGRWLSLSVRDADGSWHVHLRSFPDLDRRLRISKSSGSGAEWAADGSGVYYVTADDSGADRMIYVPLTLSGGTPRAGKARTLFQLPGRAGPAHLCRFGVSPVSGRFAVPVQVPNRELRVTEVTLLVNWARTSE